MEYNEKCRLWPCEMNYGFIDYSGQPVLFLRADQTREGDAIYAYVNSLAFFGNLNCPSDAILTVPIRNSS